MIDTTFTALGIDVGGTKIAAGIVTFPAGLIDVAIAGWK
jgi:predicted NBD/HSP70 family sugar kinase